MSHYRTQSEAFIEGRASAFVEVMQAQESLHHALKREQDLLVALRDTRRQLQKQQWVSMAMSWGCACLILLCISLAGLLSRPSS